MGAKHSKPRIRRNRRCSSIRKRQAPEGSNDPVPPPNEVYNCGNTNKKAQTVDESCKFCGAQDGFHGNAPRARHQTKICDNEVENAGTHPAKSTLCNVEFTTPRLTVDIPRISNSDCCDRWENKGKAETSPIKSTLSGPNRTSMERDKEQEWTITLYEIDKTSSQVPRDDMATLMTSIYDAVNEKAEESPQCRKTVRVRLSVTPERTTHSRLQGVERTRCQCANCPKTEPSSRKDFNDSKIKLRRSDTSSPIRSSSSHSTRHTKHNSHRNPQEYFSENSEWRKHQTNSREADTVTPFCNKNSSSDPRNMLDRTKSKPHSRHRPLTKVEGQRYSKSTRHKRHAHANDPRNLSNNGHKKEPKFASPYDQHFQEAMYLRLRELQRQGAFERRRAVGAQDSDDADDDSDFNNDDSIKPVKQQSTASTPHETRNGHVHAREITKSPTSEHNHNTVAVETVHHHHYIYHNGSYDGTEIPNKLAKDCIQNAVGSIRTDVDDNTSGQGCHIHHHHYHLADTS